MTDITIPAPDAASPEPTTTTPAAPADQAQSADGTTTPQAEKPAGEQAADKAAEPEKKEPTPGEIARKERNRARWQEMKSAAATAQQEAAQLRAELQRINGRANPDLSQLSDPDDIIAAKTAALVSRSQAEDVARRTEASEANRTQALANAWEATLEEMRARAPDFDQVVTSQTPIHVRAAPFIVESENGGEIAYWLGKNPAEAKALYQKFESAPAQALIELGRIEARIGSGASKTVSTAPKPPATLSGGKNPIQFDAKSASVDDMAGQLRKAGLIR